MSNVVKTIPVPNVTLGENLKEISAYFPCPICSEMLVVKYTKKSKPYCTCNHCGVQLFIRGKTGIKIFDHLVSDLNYQFESRELIGLIDYFEKLKNKLNEIENNKPLFGDNQDLNIQGKAIKKQLNNLREKLKVF